MGGLLRVIVWLTALSDAVLHYLAPLLAGIVVGTAVQARFPVGPKVANVLMAVFLVSSVLALFMPAPSMVRVGLALLAGIGAGLAVELEEPSPGVRVRSVGRLGAARPPERPSAGGSVRGGSRTR
jgi:hypothetical protein